jgi:FkbM family methyltransferase
VSLEFIKKPLRRTFLYRQLKLYRARKELEEWTVHDVRLHEFYSQFIKPGDVCFDVGANIGMWTKVFLALNARVVAVEPQSDCVAVLRSGLGHKPGLTIIQKGLGARQSHELFYASGSDTVSSLSTEWIAAVKSSGRFSNVEWDAPESVELTTVDNLMEQYGTPAFVKIDVEGYEDKVIDGLSRPVRALSLELTPEFPGPILRSLKRLASLGQIRINYAIGDRLKLELDEWVGHLEITRIIDTVSRANAFADVYVKFLDT